MGCHRVYLRKASTDTGSITPLTPGPRPFSPGRKTSTLGVLGRARATLHDRFHHATRQPVRRQGTEPAPASGGLGRGGSPALRSGAAPAPRGPFAAAGGGASAAVHCAASGAVPPLPGKPCSGRSFASSSFRLRSRSAPRGRRRGPRTVPPGSRGGAFRSGVRGGQPGRCEAARGGSFPPPPLGIRAPPQSGPSAAAASSRSVRGAAAASR
ncbi:atherin-like [Motacilla alba alba]|uniref:atherin-like n=1 Tax=Motacilla alba alba TaxID=1094192 RepID=UPI0018D568A0|nr:atherin-like [Motacilla alba alba]